MYVGLRQFLQAAPPLFQSPDPPIQKGGLDETPWPGHSHRIVQTAYERNMYMYTHMTDEKFWKYRTAQRSSLRYNIPSIAKNVITESTVLVFRLFSPKLRIPIWIQGSAIRCLFYSWIRNMFFPDLVSQNPYFWELVTIFGVKSTIILCKLAKTFFFTSSKMK